MTVESAGHASRKALYGEQRRFVRVRKEVSLAYRVVGVPAQPSSTVAQDMSSGGILIATQDPLRPGTEILLMAIIESTGVEFTISGRVAWSKYSKTKKRYKVGVCFVGVDTLQRENILALIARDLPSPDDSEHRRFIRLRHRVPVDYRTEEELPIRWETGYTQDISLGGFALVTNRQFDEEKMIGMRIRLDDEAEDPVVAEGRVVQSAPIAEDPGHFKTSGDFQELPPEEFERLVAFVSDRVAAPPGGEPSESQ